MEVVKECSAYLSNYEVLNILQSMKSNKKQKSKQQLATITYQTVKFLENTPSSKHTPEKIHKFLEAVDRFKLTKCEKLSLLNLCPNTALEIELIVEDSEARLTEEEVESLLQIISEHLEVKEEEQPT